ncbi:hypothetical protein [Azotobacter chroococcum]|uniref:Glycosaminoglycan attachment site n=1 Tax=Azotobacter chroococcum TaxID=353 RepID=A0AAQ0C1T5_9GAMM|nr:hypothetical protein [Azotobacter chroococcum]QQE91095.1 hypothetical protein GKQ51_23115 [Azotobacter chroococcum]
MSTDNHQLTPLTRRAFDLYSMSLPHGPNYGDDIFVSAWKSERTSGVGGIFRTMAGSFSIVMLRRRVDHCFVAIAQGGSFATQEEALSQLKAALKLGKPPEPLPAGVRRRPSIFDLGGRTPCATFRLLSETPTHWAAANAVAELYFAMPKPDPNFMSDMQSSNFDSRLWELYLFACFREQGILVSQDVPSPDFKLTNGSLQGYVEAVTANPVERRSDSFPELRHAPEDKVERMAGDAAARFARTLRSKIQRAYHEQPHVRGLPFALALADFHGGSTMVWSREALPTYLYGRMAVVKEGGSGKYAASEPIETLRGHSQIAAGLFNDSRMKGLSAVVFSNAATIAKFNRMGMLAGLAVPGVKMRRKGILFDRTPGALEPLNFDLDVESSEYAALWPDGEAWCLELEVFHNPNAEHPFPFNLLPDATHWFEHEGDIICRTVWEHTVLASMTAIQAPEALHSWPTKAAMTESSRKERTEERDASSER